MYFSNQNFLNPTISQKEKERRRRRRRGRIQSKRKKKRHTKKSGWEISTVLAQIYHT